MVNEMRQLLTYGEAPASALCTLDMTGTAGLWRDTGGFLISTTELVALLDRLPNSHEALPAVFSLVPEIRIEWLRVVLSRFREMGERADVTALVEAVTVAGDVAGELITVSAPSLDATPFGELERSILSTASHQAPAFPVLLRALAATTGMAGNSAFAASALPVIEWDDPSTVWSPGRLLRMPSVDDTAPSSAVLSGSLDRTAGDTDAMNWALHHPWGFLLAQMTFTKEAWEAERVSGGISFELEPAHVALFQNPPCIEVVVTLPSGEEVRCGSLGELTMRTLAQLGITPLAHRLAPSTLDDRLSLVIEVLLRRDIWRFEHGSGGRRPGYAIHPSFSDACYRAVGSRAFYRLGSHVTAAIRRVSETWARDRVARAGGATTAGGPE
jgi:hypothetical protein